LFVTQNYVLGRKCECTSKACKEAGVDTCRTKFFCYTELIVTTGQEISESTITKGCTKYVYRKLLFLIFNKNYA